ncbi:MAG: hypothetical protein MJ061_04840 [Mailhella sp.]|nr:hypothetical protein [Mailhella sp.]
MGFFANLFRDKAADEAKRKELDSFLAELRSKDSGAVRRIAELVVHAEKAMAAEMRFTPGKPAEGIAVNRNLCLDVSRIVRAIRRGHPEDADGYVVWLLTFRAVEDPTLKEGTSEVWRILGADAPEGFSYPEGFAPRT